MGSLKNIEELPSEIGRRVSRYMEELLSIHRENVVSIFLLGEAASGDFTPGISVVTSAVVLRNLGFDELKRSLRLVDKGIREKVAAPLFLTPEHIRTSLDTFPIEFLEMKDANLLIYGDDILAGLDIDASNIRFICEEQLKGRLIRIRQAYLEIGLRRKGMEALIKESLDSLFPVFRALLRLKGLEPPRRKADVIKSLAEAFEIDGGTFTAVLKDTKNDEKISGEGMETFLARYIQQIQQLAELSDRL